MTNGVSRETWDKATDLIEQDVVAVIANIPPRSQRVLSVYGEVGSLRLQYSSRLNVMFRDRRSIKKDIRGYFSGTRIYNEHVVIGDAVALDDIVVMN